MADLDFAQFSSSNKTSSLHGNWISKVALSLFFGYDFLNIVAVFVFVALLVASTIAFLLVAYVQCKNLWTPTSGQGNRVFRCSYVVILTLVVVVVVLFLVHYFKSSQDDVIFVQCFLIVSLLLLFIHTIVIARIIVYIQLRNLRPELRGLRFSMASVPPLRLSAEPSQGPVLLKKYSFSSHSAPTPHNRSPLPLPPATGQTGDTISVASLASPSYRLDSSDPKDTRQPPSSDMTAYYLSSRPAPATPGWYARSLSADADNKSVVSTKPPPFPTNSCSYLTLVPYHGSSSSPDPPSPTTRRDYVESVKYEVLSEQTKKKPASNSVSVPNQTKNPPGVEFNLRLDKESRVAELKMTVSMDALNLVCEQSTDTL